uniref:PFU domain-containing protein n=1 Tax=Kwoniella dejecticola CBS 10117 TaxID=1296121 RepID=A0A1A5ZTR8_9TREE|nr:uncharacterized protein I303_08588 [Kwoniella dejecticola CBS 10117]OBR81203.1 hypothetical protein I303_08588 [Kwoniella dejecticola CBS 10117]
MTDSIDPFQLSQELEPSHQGDVKAVLTISDDMIASASRDSSVGIWTRNGDSGFELKSLLNGHHAYVNSLAYIPSTDDNVDDDLLASGGNSSVILLHSLKTLASESQHCLIGHSLNVCALAFSTEHQKLISGSWDQTARIWSRRSGEWKMDVVLAGHDQAVWGVSIVDSGPKTGCSLTADRMIFLWNEQGEILQRFKGSPEPVRSLAVLPGGEAFVSACNDNLIRIWNFEGAVLDSLRGHKDYVYQVTLGSQGMDFRANLHQRYCTRARRSGPWPLCRTETSLLADPMVEYASGLGIRIEEQTREQSIVQDAMPSLPEDNEPEKPSNQPKTLTIDIDMNDEDPPIPLLFKIGADPRAAAESFGREHSLSDNYINQIEAFIRAHLD